MFNKIVLLVALSATSLLAHAGHGMESGFMSGFLHPISGADHILAMVAVGLWAAQIGGRSLVVVPVSFVLMMVLGGAFGIAGFEFAFVEEGILASVIVLGALIALGARFPLLFGAAIVGIFAIFHGIAHGNEMPVATSSLGYGAGFALATAFLHIVGIFLFAAITRFVQQKAIRIAGGAILASGLALAFV